MSTFFILIMFILSIILMVLLISKFKVHPGMSMLLAVIFLGICIGTPLGEITGVIQTGFANTIKKIAIVIVLGCVLGKVLEETGAAVSITNSTVKLFGKKNVIWAIALSSAILGIPVWADSVVIILIPIVSKLALETDESIIKYGSVLYLGALVTASLIPPTPGPIAAAALLNVPLGKAIFWGIIVAIPGIIAGVLYCKSLKAHALPKEEYLTVRNESDDSTLPSPSASLIPILIPLALIMLNTIINAYIPDTFVAELFSFVGSPLAALLIGVLTSLFLVGPTWKTKTVLNDWVDSSLKMAAMPIVVTGLGGSLALFIRNAQVAEKVAEQVSSINFPGILLPIIIAALIHAITGSNALGVMTAAAIVEPMLPILGISPLAAFLACASGALMLKHSNSSGFWVTASMSNMTLPQALVAVGGSSTVAGTACSITTIILSVIGLI